MFNDIEYDSTTNSTWLLTPLALEDAYGIGIDRVLDWDTNINHPYGYMFEDLDECPIY